MILLLGNTLPIKHKNIVYYYKVEVDEVKSILVFY